MDGFRIWLVNGNTNARKSMDQDMLIALVHETQSKTIGISAFGIFTIDYPLIFNVIPNLISV